MFRLNKNTKKQRKQAGMTYIELIVVLSIFSVMTSVVLFNYDKFQAKVDIKNLANDIALKIVEAQKSASSGRSPLASQIPLPIVPPWRPSYGVHFGISGSGNGQNFIYFTDLNQDGNYSDSSFCSYPGSTDECQDKIGITKSNFISNLDVFYQLDPLTAHPVNDLTFTFTRPNLETAIYSNDTLLAGVSYARITITSPSGTTAKIKVYPSGRVQIN